MAPDLSGMSRQTNQGTNSIAATTTSSTRPSPSLSRRTSSVMGPPPVPPNSSLPNSPRPPAASVDSGAFAVMSGPIRHPRPLTAAELHLELEKEQESIVNRLTRELSALRAQTASVASTASSTSDLFTAQNDPYLYSYNAPNIIPTAARRHRSSSNLSSRSARSTRDGLASTAAGATSVSSVAAPRDRERERERERERDQAGGHMSHSHQTSSRPSIEIPRPEMSRQNSVSGSGILAYRTSTASTAPPTASSPHWSSHTSHPHPRQSMSSSISTSNNSQSLSSLPGGDGTVHMRRSPSASISAAQAQARYEEAAMQRAELEAVKKENELLKMRIRELEKNLVEKTATAAATSANTVRVESATTDREADGDGGAPIVT